MALYSVLGPDGNTYNIEGPEGAKEQDVIAAAQNIYNNAQMQQLQQKLQQLRSEPIRPEETSGFGAARAAGWQNLQADLAALAGKTGVMDEKKAEEIIAAKQKEAARVFTPTEEGWLDSPWLKFKELAGGSLPYMAAPVAAGVTAAALPVVGVPAVAGLGMGLAGLASATQFAGSNLSRQLAEQEGEKSLAKTELAPALAAAPFQAALDIVSLRMVPGLGRVFQAAGKELTEEQLKAIAQRGLVNNVARSGAKTASAEGLTEVGQQVLERAQAGLNITDEQARDEYLDSLIGGAVLGGAVGAPAGIGARGRAQRKLDAAEAARLAEQEGKPGTSLVPMGERGVTVPETTVEETPVEFMGRENVPAATQEQIGMAPTTVPTAREALDIDEETGTAVVKANVPGAQRGQQGVLDIFGGEPVTGDELATRMQADRPSLETAAPRLTSEPRVEEVETDPRQGALQFAPAAPEPEVSAALTPRQRDTLRQAERQEQQALRQQEFEAAEAQRAEQNRAQLDRGAQETFADQAAGIFPPTFPEAKAGQPAQEQQLDLFKRKEAPVPSRAEGLRRGVGEQMGEIVPLEQTSFELTAKSLADIGIPPTAPIYKSIIDRDLADPEQRVNVSAALRKYASNPLVPKATKDAIKSVLQSSPFLRTQAELDFSKRQPKPKGAQNVGTGTPPKPAPKPSASKPPVDVGVPSDEAKAPAKGEKGTEGVSKPKQSGLGDTGGRAKPDDAGEAVAPVAVKEKKPAPVVKKEAGAKQKAEAKEVPEATPTAKVASAFDAMVNEVQKGIDAPPTWASKTIYKLEESLNESVPESVQSMLRAGDLKGALQALASASDGVTKRIVMALVKAVGGTKVNVVTDLRDEAGNKVSGTFDPETNTISLDAETGLTNHAVLHEMTHAAISHILDNPSHPITKQLTRLYNSVKPLLDTAYGAQNLQEFVAEAWGNPEFRAKLSAMTPDGTPVTAWQKFTNIVKNALRSLMGMESRGVKSAASEIDTLIEAAISPAPETRYGGSLLALSATGQGEKAFKAMSDTYNKIPYLNDDIKNNLSKFFEGTVAEKIKSFVRSALPLNALTEVAKKYIPMAPKLMQLINLRAGTESMFNAMLEPTINRARAWAAKQDADTMRTFNDVVYMSTTNGVDPSRPRKDYLDAKGNSKTDKSGNKLVDTWDQLQPKWVSVTQNSRQWRS